MKKQQIKVGKEVIYWSIKDSKGNKFNPKLTKITSD